MDWIEAIKLSKKGTATLTVKGENGIETNTVRYKDGSGFVLVSKNGEVDFFLSRPANQWELDGRNDWQPSK